MSRFTPDISLNSSRRGFARKCLLALAWGTMCLGVRADAAEEAAPFIPDPAGKLPMLALWLSHDGNAPSKMQRAPALRFAIWEDGRVLFAKDPGKWGGELQEGKIAPDKLALLKKQVAESGILKLKDDGYAVPDASGISMIVNVAGKPRLFYWDEVETPGYGINSNPKPEHLEFKRCWKQVSGLGVAAVPDASRKLSQSFRPPDSWRLR